MWKFALCAVLAQGVVAKAALPWALPDPTFAIPVADHWSPAPTRAPRLGGFELFRRQEGTSVCGYFDGISSKTAPFMIASTY